MPAIHLVRAASQLVPSTTNTTIDIFPPTPVTTPLATPTTNSSISSVAATWSLPVIIGVVLAIIAIFVTIFIGLPSAVVALKKLQQRRHPNMDNNNDHELQDIGASRTSTGSNDTLTADNHERKDTSTSLSTMTLIAENGKPTISHSHVKLPSAHASRTNSSSTETLTADIEKPSSINASNTTNISPTSKPGEKTDL
jgi:hypothetical protein